MNYLCHRKFKLREFGGYSRARQLFELCLDDLLPLAGNPACTKLVAQQIASCDSIASNIEEGYGRESRAEYARFLIYALGSAQETAARYERLVRWIPLNTVQQRVDLCGEIIGILDKTIRNLRAGGTRAASP